MSALDTARRNARVAAVRDVLRTAAQQFVPEPPGILDGIAPAVADWIDALRADDQALVEELRDALVSDRKRHAEQTAHYGEQHARLLLAATARERAWSAAVDELRATGTAAQRASITRLDRAVSDRAAELLAADHGMADD